ncbi:MAG: G/U mismatch-specific DNA glycosylase [bacterium]|nr:G/U mismatch-specific DNA glycosylase [bacterium]
MERKRPTKEDLVRAIHKKVPDVISNNLKVLFVGINPGLYTAAIGHHFGRPGNRFWPALYSAGFTKRLLSPYEESELLKVNIGITNLAARATNTAAEVSVTELKEGVKILEEKIKKYHPEWVVILGVQSYRQAFDRPKAQIGLQEEKIAQAKVWLLPNPSGLNAHFSPNTLTKLFKELKSTI